MEKETLFKSDPTIEAEKRLNMAYLLLKNPQVIEIMQKTGSYFFHGTNANALPSILKYGINSINTSRKNNIEVSTGEKWSRINGERSFVSVTDCLDTALLYASMGPNKDGSTNFLLNFGVLIGISFEDMKDIRTYRISSDISEIGVVENLPLKHIKFLAVPADKAEFVKKIVEQKNIEVVSMDIADVFYANDFNEKLDILEQSNEKIETNQPYPTYSQDDIRPVVNTRRTSKIKEIFENLKSKILIRTKKTDDKDIGKRG